jgi:CDP-diacylglycerol--glycerol-3-phosphate 3-phosphatidyltransferase
VNYPIVIVCARALLTVPICWLVTLAASETDAVALVLFLFACASDAVDGRIARARGEVTDLGARLDPLADKILIVGTLTALALRGLIPIWALAVIVGRELLAVGVRATAGPLPSTADGKAKTVLQAGAAAATLLAAATRAPELASQTGVLVLAAVTLTVLSGLRLVLRAAQIRSDTARARGAHALAPHQAPPT